MNQFRNQNRFPSRVTRFRHKQTPFPLPLRSRRQMCQQIHLKQKEFLTRKERIILKQTRLIQKQSMKRPTNPAKIKLPTRRHVVLGCALVKCLPSLRHFLLLSWLHSAYAPAMFWFCLVLLLLLLFNRNAF